MFVLLLGLVALLVVMGALGAFSRAEIATLKQFGLWVVGIGGLLLGALLLLTGRGAVAVSTLLLLGPLLWSWIGETRQRGPAPTARQRMSRDEAYQVLGLAPGASRDAILAAHRRLMRAAHPDAGGSDWLAARINQARDILLG